jgi:acyl-CoA dehydrogenase
MGLSDAAAAPHQRHSMVLCPIDAPGVRIERMLSVFHGYGKPLIQLGGNGDILADLRIAIEQARLLTLKAAWLIDTRGVKAAMSEIAQIKVIAPAVAQKAADAAMQIHGGASVSGDFPLAALYAYARVLRLVDGPDEVHRGVIAKMELKAQLAAAMAQA